MISKTINEINARCFIVLEGGYSKEISKLALKFFESFTA
jgi:acetoin utilization deacetylase AcuC-like enzyme